MKPAESANEVVGELASCHGQEFVTLAYLLSGSSDEAEDIVQTVLTRLLGGAVIARVENRVAYTRRAIMNEFLDRRRRIRRGRSALDALRREPLNLTSVEGSIAEREALLQAFSVLRPRERTCIVLRYYADWDDASIAAAIGCAPATVRSLVARALPRLRKALEAASTPQLGMGDVR